MLRPGLHTIPILCFTLFSGIIISYLGVFGNLSVGLVNLALILLMVVTFTVFVGSCLSLWEKPPKVKESLTDTGNKQNDI